VYLFVSPDTPILGEVIGADFEYGVLQCLRAELERRMVGATPEDLEQPPELSPAELQMLDLQEKKQEYEKIIAELSEKLDSLAKIEMNKDKEIHGLGRKIEILEQDVRKIKAEKMEQVDLVKDLTRKLNNKDKAFDQTFQDKTQLETLFLKEKEARKRAEKERSDLEIKNSKINNSYDQDQKRILKAETERDKAIAERDKAEEFAEKIRKLNLLQLAKYIAKTNPDQEITVTDFCKALEGKRESD